jgi:hypothetical protein
VGVVKNIASLLVFGRMRAFSLSQLGWAFIRLVMVYVLVSGRAKKGLHQQAF